MRRTCGHGYLSNLLAPVGKTNALRLKDRNKITLRCKSTRRMLCDDILSFIHLADQSTIDETQLLPVAKCQTLDAACTQLKNVTGAPIHGHAPGRQAANAARDASRGGNKHDIEGEFHPEGMDTVARTQQQTFFEFEFGFADQAKQAGAKSVCPPDVVDQHQVRSRP